MSDARRALLAIVFGAVGAACGILSLVALVAVAQEPDPTPTPTPLPRVEIPAEGEMLFAPCPSGARHVGAIDPVTGRYFDAVCP